MKKLFLILCITLAALTGVRAQATAAGDVTLEMADGSKKRGYSRTEMKNEVKFFELSAEPKGERTRYDNDQIARIVFDNGAEYVKQDYSAGVKVGKLKNAWLRLEHKGNGITLYSGYREYMEQVNTTRRRVRQTNYYVQIGDGPAVWASAEYHSGGVLNAAGANRTMLNYLFSKTYKQYADLAKRVKAKEFDTKGSPIEVVRAWEEAYGGK